MEQLLTGTGVVRTPIFPFSLYQGILSGRLSVEELINIPAFMHGLFLASPDLHAACAWLFDTDVEPGKVAKLKQAILKYAYRASTRSTPFGLFSGLSTFTVSPTTTEFTLNPPTQCRTHVRLDVDFVGQLADHLARQPYIKPYLLYQRNSSLYTLGNSYRYFGQTYKNRVKKFELKSVQATPVLTNLFDLAATPTMLSVLADSLVDEDVNHDEAVSFLYDLIEQQLLVSELTISGTGAELGWQLVTTLNRVMSRVTNAEHQADLRATAGQIERLLQTLSALETVGRHSITAYSAIKQQASELMATLTNQSLLQCDTLLSFSTAPQLAATTVADVQRANSTRRYTSTVHQGVC
jgi:lantibiotic biosynthesis protein